MAIGDIIVIGPLKVNTFEPDDNGNITIPGISPDGTIALAQTAAKLATPILINGVSFDGSQNINTVPASATFSSTAGKLLNSVTINGIPFDGSSDIIISDAGSGEIAGTGILYVADDNTTSTTTYIPFLFNTSGSADTLTVASSSLTFNPATGQLSTTSFNSITGLSSTNTDIKINGTQSAGSLTTVAKADHIHPTDTTRAPLASPTFTGTVSGITNSMVGLSNVTNTAQVTSVSGSIPIVSSGGTTPTISIPQATSSISGYMTSTYASKLDSIAENATSNIGTVTSVAAGNGMSFTTITGTGTVTLGTPSTCSSATTNTASATSHTHIIGNAATVTTNANLTGVITSIGNTTSIASQTGTGTKFVVDNSPTLITPNIGAATGNSFNSITGLSSTATDIKINGTQSAGSLTTVAKADHIHPTDTTRAPLASPTFTGTVSGITNSMVGLGNVPNLSFSGSNTGDNATNSLYSGLVTNATHTGDATGSTALTVVKINGTLMSGLGTGILKNTNGTGVPSIAIAADFPTLNQNTTGTAASVGSLTGIATVAPLMNGAQELGASTLGARQDHVHASDTSREPSISTGTTDQYWRGDKTWQSIPGIKYIADDNSTSTTTYIPFLFNNSGSTDTLTVASSSLTFNPAIGQLSTTSFNSTSDARKKENIQDLHYGLDTVLQLKPKEFNFIASKQKSFGFIAQDIIEQIPEVVSLDDDGFMGINYSILTAILVQSIQELKIEINLLKTQIK